MAHSLKKIAHWIDALNSPEGSVSGFAFDSREVQRGDLFFALDGQKVNGHAFLGEVARKGGRAAVVLEDYQGPDHGLALLKVPDVTLALQQAAKERLGELHCQVAAITGSVGKTTTKEFAAQLLSGTYRVHAPRNSFNTQVGLPLTILQAPNNCEVLILEMGMSERGNIARLLEIAAPDIALLTTIDYVHSAFFGSLEEIAMEKAMIFSHSITGQGLVCADIPLLEEVMGFGSCPKRTFSTRNGADLTLQIGEGRVTPIVEGRPQPPCPWTLPCRHNLDNFLAAASLCTALDLPWEAIAARSATLKLPKMRFEQSDKGGVTVINDAYNACARSMCAALDSLPAPKPGGRRIAVLGGMRELGTQEGPLHRQVAEHALGRIDGVLLVGKEWAGLEAMLGDKLLGTAASSEELLPILERHIQRGDVLLVKGSRSYALERVVDNYPGPRR
ncbi:MAG: UDP-N-acetylmuramoyl-tripeptide--D-alanyl-D-alanine ligase [Parachlamydiales bacterium]